MFRETICPIQFKCFRITIYWYDEFKGFFKNNPLLRKRPAFLKYLLVTRLGPFFPFETISTCRCMRVDSHTSNYLNIFELKTRKVWNFRRHDLKNLFIALIIIKYSMLGGWRPQIYVHIHIEFKIFGAYPMLMKMAVPHLLISFTYFYECNIILFYWPKDKSFILLKTNSNIFSMLFSLTLNSVIFISIIGVWHFLLIFATCVYR